MTSKGLAVATAIIAQMITAPIQARTIDFGYGLGVEVRGQILKGDRQKVEAQCAGFPETVDFQNIEKIMPMLYGKSIGCRVMAREKIFNWLFLVEESQDKMVNLANYEKKMAIFVEVEKELQESLSNSEKSYAESCKPFGDEGRVCRARKSERKKDKEVRQKNLEELHDFIYSLQDYWVMVNAPGLLLAPATDEHADNFKKNFGIGAGVILAVFTAWSMLRGKGFKSFKDNSKETLVAFSKKSLKGWARIWSRTTRASARVGLRRSANAAVFSGGRGGFVSAIGVTSGNIAGRSVLTGGSTTGAKQGRKPHQMKKVNLVENAGLAVASPISFFRDEVKDEAQMSGKVRTALSFLDEVERKDFLGISAAMGAGFLAAEGAEYFVGSKAFNATLKKRVSHLEKEMLRAKKNPQQYSYRKSRQLFRKFGRNLASDMFGRASYWVSFANIKTMGARLALFRMLLNMKKLSVVVGGISGVVVGVLADYLVRITVEKHQQNRVEQDVIHNAVRAFDILVDYETQVKSASRFSTAVQELLINKTYGLMFEQDKIIYDFVRQRVCLAAATPSAETLRAAKASRTPILHNELEYVRKRNDQLLRKFPMRLDAFLSKNKTSMIEAIDFGEKAKEELLPFGDVALGTELAQLDGLLSSFRGALDIEEIYLKAVEDSQKLMAEVKEIKEAGDVKAYKEFLDLGYGCENPYERFEFGYGFMAN